MTISGHLTEPTPTLVPENNFTYYWSDIGLVLLTHQAGNWDALEFNFWFPGLWLCPLSSDLRASVPYYLISGPLSLIIWSPGLCPLLSDLQASVPYYLISRPLSLIIWSPGLCPLLSDLQASVPYYLISRPLSLIIWSPGLCPLLSDLQASVPYYLISWPLI